MSAQIGVRMGPALRKTTSSLKNRCCPVVCRRYLLAFFQFAVAVHVLVLSKHTAQGYREVGLGVILTPAKIGVQSALSRYGGTWTNWPASGCTPESDTEVKLDDRFSSAEAMRLQSETNGILFESRQRERTSACVDANSISDLPHHDKKSKVHLSWDNSRSPKRLMDTSVDRGGAADVGSRPLLFWETMLCGAISRSAAQTAMHPANTMKTMLQNSKGPVVPAIRELLRPSSFHRLTYGAGTNFILSVPNGALNFSVLELVRKNLGILVANNPYLADRATRLGPGLDFLSSSVSTVVCSIVATPQMMITDNIMAGNYPNLFRATQGLARKGGVKAFYRGWLPAMVSKIPSYALTWTLFQELKALRNRLSGRQARNIENSIMGCIASATSVCIMIPVDTIKTRLVTQGGTASISSIPYKGIIDCAARVYREEGIGAFYRGLPPRLVSVVPLIGIQFTVYEATKRFITKRPVKQETLDVIKGNSHGTEESKRRLLGSTSSSSTE